MNAQIVYFDPEDEAMDGYGWNVVDADTDTGVAARFATENEAAEFCRTSGFTFVVMARPAEAQRGFASVTPGVRTVTFEWDTRLGDCYECGLPAAFFATYKGSTPTPETLRCSVCAANNAADGEGIARIEPLD